MPLSNKNKKFLVVRTDKIGDTVLSTPVLELIKKAFPESYLGVLIRPYTFPIIQNNPFADEIITFEENSGLRNFLSLASQLRKARYDIALVLFSHPKVALLLKLAGIPHCIGPASKIEQFLYNKRIRQKRSRCEKHEADYNMEIALAVKDIDIIKESISIKPRIWVTEQEEKKADDILKDMGFSSTDNVVVVHPGDGGSARNWSPEQYGVICDKIKSQTGSAVIITWGKGEEEILKRTMGSARQSHMNFGGRETSLRDLIALLKRADVIFTSSTGPLHIAGAVGTRTVSIFCPIRVSLPKRWGPVGYEGQHTVLLPAVPICTKCTGSECIYFDCMNSIHFEDVLQAIVEQLNDKNEQNCSGSDRLRERKSPQCC